MNEKTINQLSVGKCHIYEPGLEDLLISCRSNIEFSLLNNKTEKQIMNFDAVLIAVGTPTVNGRADLSQIKTVARMLGRLVKESDKYISIIIKSTVVSELLIRFSKILLSKSQGKRLEILG